MYWKVLKYSSGMKMPFENPWYAPALNKWSNNITLIFLYYLDVDFGCATFIYQPLHQVDHSCVVIFLCCFLGRSGCCW